MGWLSGIVDSGAWGSPSTGTGTETAPDGLQWTIDSPGFRQQWEQLSSSRESGGDASHLLQDMFNTATDRPPEYNENSRPGFAYAPGYKYAGSFDVGGALIPGTLQKIGLDDPMFDAAVMAAIAVTGANIGAAGAIGGASGGSAASGAAGSSAGGLSSADLSALYGNTGYGAGMTGAETAAFDASLGSGLGGLPAASYSNEGLHYGAGGLNPVTSSPINSSAGFNWSELGSNLQQAGRGLNLVNSLAGGGQQQQFGGSAAPSLGFRSPTQTAAPSAAPLLQTLVLQQPQQGTVRLPSLANDQEAVLNGIRQWLVRSQGGKR